MSWAMSFSFSERADEAIGTSFYQKQGDDMGNDICLIVHYTEQFVKRDRHPKSRRTENWPNNQVSCSASFLSISLWVPALFFREEDALDLGIQLRRVHAHLASKTTAFIATKRGLGMNAMVGVDGENTGPHGLRHTQRTPQVLCPDRAGEAIGGIIG